MNGGNVSEILREITVPPATISPVDWAEQFVAEIPYSPIPGGFRASNSPMIAPVMEAITNARIKLVCVVACVQSGKSLAPELSLAYIIANAPGPTLWLDVTDDSAKGKSENRLRPLFENCAPVKALFNDDKNKMRNATMIFKNGMTLWIVGANNRRNLQSRSIRYVFGDETWLWERGRMAEAEARTTAFKRGKCVFFSQAGISGDDTDAKFLSTTQGEWTFSCPQCGKRQAFEWENLHWDGNAKNEQTREWNLERVRSTAVLTCPHCGNVFENTDAERRRLNASGKFVSQNPSASREHLGFHWNALATMDWGALAVQFLEAKAIARRGDISKLQTFFQQRLAIAWKEDVAAQDLVSGLVNEGFFKLGEAWSGEGFFDIQTGRIVPAGTPGATDGVFPRLRFMTVDVQADYFYWIVRMWSADGSSRLLACGMVQSFDEIKETASKWNVFPVFTFIDCGYKTPQVLSFCAGNNFTALRGDQRTEWNFTGRYKRYYSPRETVDCGNGRIARRHYFSTLRIKDILFELRAGHTHAKWEIPGNAPAHYLKMLSSERRNNEKQVWEQIGKTPNHFFDCEVMNVCAALMLGLVGAREGESG